MPSITRTRRNVHSHSEKAPLSTHLFQVSGYGQVIKRVAQNPHLL